MFDELIVISGESFFERECSVKRISIQFNSIQNRTIPVFEDRMNRSETTKINVQHLASFEDEIS
jgi:hypothetical protein